MTVTDPAIIPPSEPARLAAVRRYDILDTPPDGAFDRITSLAARLFNVPIAIVSVVDEDRIWFKSHHGLEIDQIDRDPGLCASAILQDGPWIVSDAPRDPRALANPLVVGEFGLRFYAGVPLRTDDGYNLGTMCILDFEPRELAPRDVATLEDLGAMVMSELELRLASRRTMVEVREREELKDAVLGMLSHELRTPVTTIYGAVQILLRDPSMAASERARDLLPDVASESERLLRLIDNLLVLTRLERDRLEAGREPVLLQRVLPKVIDHESRRAGGRVVERAIAPDLPPVAGDQIYLEQVVSNLLSNAFKYSPDGSPILVSAGVVGDDVEVRVEDRGIGIRPDQLDAVFGLLVRTPEGERHAAGAGIGLYVCRRLVEAMGGRIRAETPAAGGTAFVFRVPIDAT